MSETFGIIIIIGVWILTFAVGVIYGVTTAHYRMEAHNRHIKEREEAKRDEDAHYYNHK